MKNILFICLSSILILFISCQSDKKYVPEAVELNKIGEELIKFNRYDSALFVLDKATKIDSSYYVAYGNKVLIYCELGNYKKALFEAEKQVKAKPDLAEGWMFAGMLHDGLGDTTKAQQYYLKSIDLYMKRFSISDTSKNAISTRINLATALILSGDEKNGREEFLKIKTEHPKTRAINQLINTTKKDFIDQIFCFK